MHLEYTHMRETITWYKQTIYTQKEVRARTRHTRPRYASTPPDTAEITCFHFPATHVSKIRENRCSHSGSRYPSSSHQPNRHSFSRHSSWQTNLLADIFPAYTPSSRYSSRRSLEKTYFQRMLLWVDILLADTPFSKHPSSSHPPSRHPSSRHTSKHTNLLADIIPADTPSSRHSSRRHSLEKILLGYAPLSRHQSSRHSI